MDNQIGAPAPQGDTYSYKGWIISDNFLKRSFAIYGYSMVAGLIVSAIIFIPIMLIATLIFGQAISQNKDKFNQEFERSPYQDQMQDNENMMPQDDMNSAPSFQQ